MIFAVIENPHQVNSKAKNGTPLTRKKARTPITRKKNKNSDHKKKALKTPRKKNARKTKSQERRMQELRSQKKALKTPAWLQWTLPFSVFDEMLVGYARVSIKEHYSCSCFSDKIAHWNFVYGSMTCINSVAISVFLDIAHNNRLLKLYDLSCVITTFRTSQQYSNSAYEEETKETTRLCFTNAEICG